jgi:hypothetical protein
MKRKIIFFELNEVPFKIVDAFCRWRPGSHLARLLPSCRQYETHSEDISSLSPWKTWPSVHRGVNDARHMIQDFGQDLAEVDREFPPIWQILASHGIRTGVCGSLHTYPPPADYEGYAFFLPDTFAAGAECFPKQLSIYQDFNLRMARDSARNVSQKVPWKAALSFLAAAPGLGLRLATAMDVGGQLVSERLAEWKKTRRRTYQVVLAFDVFMKQLADTRPDFCTFFTNHVASSMHRYWAATFPEEYGSFGFDEQWVTTYRNEIDFTMSKFDEFLGRLVAFVDRNPEFQLWVTTSMGQHATVALPLETQLYVVDLERLMSALGVPSGRWRPMPAMLPQSNVFVDASLQHGFEDALRTLEIDGQPLSWRQSESGFYSLDFGHPNAHLRNSLPRLWGESKSYQELGLDNVKIEDRSGTTAYHIPQGSLFIYDANDRRETKGRPTISSLEIAPTILNHFAVPIPAYMKAPITA